MENLIELEVCHVEEEKSNSINTIIDEDYIDVEVC